MKKHVLVHLFFLVISALVYWQGIPTAGPDLVWNMVLALVAYDAAVIANYVKNKWLVWPVLLIWLVFYPNTFYMITDLVHMDWVGQTLWNRASLKLFMAFVPSILFGVMCGIASWNMIVERLRLNWLVRHISIVVLSFISSMAIYIGRYDRLNSWDLVSNPSEVYHRLIGALQPERLLFILGFALIQTMCLVFLDHSTNKK
ncbi:DUF1361 domain-containing protein [Streptococcus massiliensis]|uniref:Membrane protein n=1 Tax=Streptococcus massiliensis TaxID=313439 RepID=A0A380KXK3_9STRE|nr:DUF1361 domain-containing protein [Streptococcus massiliensis]SUN76683.1 membrane protein [Streptococcus massiliensis]